MLRDFFDFLAGFIRGVFVKNVTKMGKSECLVIKILSKLIVIGGNLLVLWEKMLPKGEKIQIW